ncbi:MAG: hypothetical protein IH945_11320 [Armatimonadetes bacterium]|nr:hypothetical protein [Armatimonadota bacterium]
MFTRLDDDRWEVVLMPLARTRIVNEEQRQAVHSELCLSMRYGILTYLGLLLTTALKPLFIWLSLTVVLYFRTEVLVTFVLLAIVPMVAFFVIGIWPLARRWKLIAKRRHEPRASRGRRVKWIPYWRLVGSALGPKPIKTVLALAAACLISTVIVSAMIREAYLTDIVNMATLMALIAPAIPAGLRSRNGRRASVAAKEE